MLEIKSLSDDLDEPSRRKVGKNTARDFGESFSGERSGDFPEEFLGRANNSKISHELVITQLTEGVRNRNRVNVFINGKFSLSLDVKQVVDLQVKVGRKLSKAELENLRSAAEFGKLYQRALEWVLMRPRSIQETRDYLKRSQLKRNQLNRKREQEEHKPLPEIQDAAINLVLERLVERGYVDDYKFAEYFVENRFVKKGISRRRLSMELRKKGIADSIIAKVLDDSKRNDSDELTKMIRKKRAKYDDEKLIAYLVRQGFEYQAVREAVEQFEEDDGTERQF